MGLLRDSLLIRDRGTPDGAGGRVLFAVPDRSTWLAVLRRIEADGNKISVVRSCRQAVAALRDWTPDLLVMDVNLPGGGALDLCRQIKIDETRMRLPVVVVTGEAAEESRAGSCLAGADDFFAIPVDRVVAVARIRALLRAKRVGDRLFSSFLDLDRVSAVVRSPAETLGADAGPIEILEHLARQIADEGGGSSPNHPAVFFLATKGSAQAVEILRPQAGAGDSRRSRVRCDWVRLVEAISPMLKDDGALASNGPPPPALRRLLRLPPGVKAANFVAVLGDELLILAAGYPLGVGVYETPVLKAIARNWRTLDVLRQLAEQTEEALTRTIDALAMAAEFYDAKTGHHLYCVSRYTEIVAKGLGLPLAEAAWIARCARMHDVGKIAVPLGITRKPGPLDEGERAVMIAHTLSGARILARPQRLVMARDIARWHHENWDGSGYPDGLRGDRIPLGSRIVRIVDVYDALRMPRPYKPIYSHEEALTVLRNGDGRTRPAHFNPEVLAALLDHHAQLRREHEDSLEWAVTPSSIDSPDEAPSP